MRRLVGFLSVISVFSTMAFGCAAENRQTDDSEEADVVEEPAISGSFLIYERGVRGELPERVTLKDGSCWDFTKAATPWGVTRVTDSGFALEAPSDALGVPHRDLDTVEQQRVRISLGYNPTYKWPGSPSPQRIQEMLDTDLIYEYPAYSRPPFRAFQLGEPQNETNITYLADSERNLSCRMWPLNLPNPGIHCERYSNSTGRVYTYRLPASALDQLDVCIDEFTTVLNNLVCSEGE